MSAHVDDNYIYLVDSPSLCWIVSYAINPTRLMSPPFSSAMQPINATNPIPLCHRAGSVLCNPCDIMANGSLSFWMFRFCWSWPTASCSVIDRCMPAQCTIEQRCLSPLREEDKGSVHKPFWLLTSYLDHSADWWAQTLGFHSSSILLVT